MANRARLALVAPWLQPGSLSLVARACPARPEFSKGILPAIFTRHHAFTLEKIQGADSESYRRLGS